VPKPKGRTFGWARQKAGPPPPEQKVLGGSFEAPTLLKVMEKWRVLVKTERERRGRFKGHPETKTCWNRFLIPGVNVEQAIRTGRVDLLGEVLCRLMYRRKPGDYEFTQRLARNVYQPIVEEWIRTNKVLIAELVLIK
jgi:hypothetical protein